MVHIFVDGPVPLWYDLSWRKAMKKVSALVTCIALLYLVPPAVSAQQNDLAGLWYGHEGRGALLSVYQFTENGQYRKTNYYQNYRCQPFSSIKFAPYQIKDAGILQLGKESVPYRVSKGAILVMLDVGEGAFPPITERWIFYYPVSPANGNTVNLQGTWKTTLDRELTIDDKTIIYDYAKGKQIRTFTYTSEGFPDLILYENGRRFYSSFFFLSEHILEIAIPDEGILLFQRVTG
jgi:hypothetical protein